MRRSEVLSISAENRCSDLSALCVVDGKHFALCMGMNGKKRIFLNA
jgi:hypothetical protein